MGIQPFLKWAGGKRWLVSDLRFNLPHHTGSYIEPFLGGGAVFFHRLPARARLSDLNGRLIEVYQTIRDGWADVSHLLGDKEKNHCRDFYYEERARVYLSEIERTAQFLYLNRTCWNGLYRENLRGVFNVPMGTKTKIIDVGPPLDQVANALKGVDIHCCDFEESIDLAKAGDLIFADPPYTTAHNFNGFVKYNQTIFSWNDQERLCRALLRARARGSYVVLTNADHSSVHDLYANVARRVELQRSSVISGNAKNRGKTSEALFVFN